MRGTLFGYGETADFQALKLILQPGSDDELEVNPYGSRNDCVEDEDFARDVPKIDANPEYETNKDRELNSKPGTNDGGKENCFVDIFQRSPKTCKQCCSQTKS